MATDPDRLPDARTIAGLLADADRRAVAAALILGAGTLAEVCATTGLDARTAATALARLAGAGLVTQDGDKLRLDTEAFEVAARVESAETQPAEYADEPPERSRVLRAFVRGNRLTSIPTTRSKRLVVLDLLAQQFEPGHRYSEVEVNGMLRRWHADTASLRRYLVDEELLLREAGVYWRAGGTFDVDSDR